MPASRQGLGAALAAAGLLCHAVAMAQEAEPEDPGAAEISEAPPEPAAEPDEPDEPDEVLYVDDQAVIRARQEVGLALRDMGYDRKRTRNGREVYVNEVPWKPQVVVDDDGWMVVRRAPPSFGKPELPGIWRGPLGYLVCVANPTACVHIGGWVISERKLAWHKEAVVSYVDPTMGRYEDALVARAFNQHTGLWIPEALEALWERGEPLDGDTPLETHAERRAAMLELWSSRNCNEWGAAVRAVVRDYMQYEVQPGPHPFTADEVARANLDRRCEEALIIDGLQE
jgi:hypothetical protein